jgi:hypothetical protein
MPWVGKAQLETDAPVDSWIPRPSHPSKVYKPEFVEYARHYCSLGAIDSELAEFFGVAVQTIGQWKLHYEAFGTACYEGAAANIKRKTARVKEALYNRAVGYTYDSTKFFCNDGEVITTPYLEHVPPDIKACTLWLINNDTWKDKAVELTGSNKGPIGITISEDDAKL